MTSSKTLAVEGYDIEIDKVFPSIGFGGTKGSILTIGSGTLFYYLNHRKVHFSIEGFPDEEASGKLPLMTLMWTGNHVDFTSWTGNY